MRFVQFHLAQDQRALSAPPVLRITPLVPGGLGSTTPVEMDCHQQRLEYINMPTAMAIYLLASSAYQHHGFQMTQIPQEIINTDTNLAE